MTKPLCGVLMVIACYAETGPRTLLAIESGAATFNAATNLPGVEVKGTSRALTGRVEILQNASGLTLQHIDASVPVKTLATGMKVRDEHMRKYIFTTPEGKEPDLRFNADGVSCPSSGASQFACQVSGTLTIRGVAAPFTIRLRVKEQGSATAFRAEGDGIVKLHDYGINSPSQFGVTPQDEVKLHLEFAAKAAAISDGTSGGSK